jgi:phosphonate transport system ATP-binding protein
VSGATEPALALERVSKRFGAVVALDGVSLAARAGEVTVLLGPSGAGKSTVFRCLTALERPDEGAVTVRGARIDRLRGAALRDARRAIGLVFQQHNLVGRLSAIDNVLSGRLGATPTWRVLARRFAPADRQLALGCLDRGGLLERAYERADRLSGGQQQRVAIARALAQRGGVVLADEPVASLDPESAEHVMDTLRTIAHDGGVAVLCSLHQVELARRFGDVLVGLREGRVVFSGPPAGFDEAARRRVYAAARGGAAANVEGVEAAHA